MRRVTVGVPGAAGVCGALLLAALTGCSSNSGSESTYPVGGTVAGLTVSGLALQNGTDVVNLAAGATAFQFPTRLTAGTAYDVSVAQQPNGLVCGVHDGSGTVGTGAAATNVSVYCVSGQEFVYAGGNLFAVEALTGALALQAITVNCCVRAVADPLGHFLYGIDIFSVGIDSWAIDPASGFLTPLAQIPPPIPAGFTSLATDASGKFLYATAVQQPSIYAYSIGAGGSLTPLSGSPFPAGSYPVALAVDGSGSWLYSANMHDGTISAYTIGANGTLTPVSGSPFQLVAPGAGLDDLEPAPAGGYLYAHAGVGTGSGIYVRSINPHSGALSAVAGSPFDKPQDGPSSLAISPAGQFILLANQNSNTISVSAINKDGTVSPVKGSPFPGGGIGGQIAAEPLGKFVYTAGNAAVGQLYVSGFAINGTTGALTLLPTSPFTSGAGSYVLVVRPSP
jgi:6-phosphogluconolactonase (cycloisomerase 2 family)